jgi:predicted secreted protein
MLGAWCIFADNFFGQFALGDQFTVSLASNPSTGYSWELSKPSALLQVHFNESAKRVFLVRGLGAYPWEYG